MRDRIQPSSESSPEIRSIAFFDRSALAVAEDLSEFFSIPGVDFRNFPKGQGKVIRVKTLQGEHAFQILQAIAYSSSDPERMGKIWKGKRADKIRNLQPGHTITYPCRNNARMTFVVARGADNVGLVRVKNIETGEEFTNSSQVSRALCLEAGDKGRLLVDDSGILNFSRIQN